MRTRVAASLMALMMSGPAIAGDKQRLEFSGRLLIDLDRYDAVYSKDAEEENMDGELRLGRVQLDYDFPKGWLGKIQVESDGDGVELGSTYLRYTKWDTANITIGKMKEPIGLERNTNSADLWIIEGAMMTSAFTPGKNWGVNLYSATDTRRWAIAATFDDDDLDTDAPYALSGRYTWTLLTNEQQSLQVGGSASWRGGNDSDYQVRERAEVNLADNIVRSAQMIAREQQIVGLEALWLYRSLSLQTEYMATRVSEKGGDDWDYDGFYLMGSYFPGGYQRELKRGETRRVKPGTDGLWELVARYGELDVRQNGIGSTAAVTTLGANYYVNNDFRVMLNVKYADVAGSVRHEETDGYAVSVRLQLLF
jgi:phosphate-selective porin OprO and OprP